jgi:AcrR family transcriptional regulator
MTTKRSRRRTPPPEGKEEVVAAIVAAARTSFADLGYSGASVRDIAKTAKVNHGLVHRHFGSKEGLLRAVLQGMFKDVDALTMAEVKPGDPGFIDKLYPAVCARKQDWQILMRAVLDGFDFKASGFEFPLTTAMVEHVAAVRGKRDETARFTAGAIIAGGLGWLLLETYLAPILNLDGVDREVLRERAGSLYQKLVDAKPSRM